MGWWGATVAAAKTFGAEVVDTAVESALSAAVGFEVFLPLGPTDLLQDAGKFFLRSIGKDALERGGREILGEAMTHAGRETVENAPLRCRACVDEACFVAGTPVLMAELATDHHSLSDAPPLDASPRLDSLLAATLVATVTIGGTRLRRWTRRRRHRFAVDDFFRTLGSPDHHEEVPHG